VPAAGAISARLRCPPAVFPSLPAGSATLLDAAAVERLYLKSSHAMASDGATSART